MKKDQNMLFVHGAYRKDKALAKLLQLLLSLRSIFCIEAFNSSAAHQEKLQIRYANIRV